MDITIKLISKLIHGKRRLKILDIGCGHGHDLVELANKFPGNEFYGFDPSFNGRKEMEVNGSKVILSHGDAVHKWPHDFRNFDLIYSSAVLHLINKKEWKHFFLNIKHHLVHGGKCVIIDTRTKDNEVYYTVDELRDAVGKYFHIIHIDEFVQHDMLPYPHNHRIVVVVCRRRFL